MSLSHPPGIPRRTLQRFAVNCVAAVLIAGPVRPQVTGQHGVTSHSTQAQASVLTVPHEFIYISPIKLNSVAVAGTFNNWN
jgi:hypothetical protein